MLSSGGEPFILVVEQLPPHLHAAGGDIQASQRSGGKGILHDVLRQEGKPHAVLDHLAEQGSAAQLEEGLDGQPLCRHALVEGIAVAHAPLGQQELLPGQFLKRDLRLPGQWVPGEATTQIGSGSSTASTKLGCSSGLSSV